MGVKTGVPYGKTMKNITYKLGCFICDGREDQSHNDGLLVDEDDVVDNEFDDGFTLSVFWRDLMVLSAEQFSEVYGMEKKNLGTKCKLYIKKLWKGSAWMEVTSTELLKNSIED